jgi:hypothetical protein
LLTLITMLLKEKNNEWHVKHSQLPKVGSLHSILKATWYFKVAKDLLRSTLSSFCKRLKKTGNNTKFFIEKGINTWNEDKISQRHS